MRLLGLIFPRQCVVCGTGDTDVCEACAAALPRLRAPLCDRCGAPTAWPVARCSECAGRRVAFARARAAVRYQGPVPEVVSAWKERGRRHIAELAADLVAAEVPRPDARLVTFVPADPDRGLKRDHHPAERLARNLALTWDLPCEALLARRPGRPQRGLSLHERRRNVRGAFKSRGWASSRVVLVDDVYTSGATVSAAASALRRAGARGVEVVSFARAVR